MNDTTEILSVNLLEQNRPLVEELKQLAASLGIGLGWHYLLDLSWIISQLGPVGGRPLKGLKILDAGAGTGLMQWFLAGKGVEVTSVDRTSRSLLPLHYRARYRVSGLRAQDLQPASRVVAANVQAASNIPAKLARFVRGGAGVLAISLAPGAFGLLTGAGTAGAGCIQIYNQDLTALVDIPTASMDAVVAVSALEHNPPESLLAVVAELMRVLKPGGVLLATLGAAPDRDWFHEPSMGWCYTEASLRRMFSLADTTPSNYDQYPELLTTLVNCHELSDHLAPFYYQSGENGMPWGKWDPQYQVVGICKMKQ
jgi:SAM-dependent methyltransferase